MALKVNRPGRTVEYVLEADRESAETTKFDLRRLSWEQLIEVGEVAPINFEAAVKIKTITDKALAEMRDLTNDDVARINEIVPDGVQRVRAARKVWADGCRSGIAGMRGLVDEAGEPLEMTVEIFLGQAHPDTLQELWGEIQRISRLGEPIKKN